mgnify:CR=1 FL=1
MVIAKEEFRDWKESKVTEYVLDTLENMKDDYMEALRGFVRVGESVQAARCEGMIEGLEQLLAIDYEDTKDA